jgi:DNA-directed RNA polymerase specialized sigma subunit
MRYKQNMMDKLEQAETLVSRLDIQLSRNASQEQIFETLEILKEQLNNAKEMVSIESDDFEQQFADR